MRFLTALGHHIEIRIAAGTARKVRSNDRHGYAPQDGVIGRQRDHRGGGQQRD
jgi:hypothetical protein